MKREYFKYNYDDILEVLTEALAAVKGFGTFISHSKLIVDNGEIYFVGVIGESDDSGINKIDLNKLYAELEYNGTHPDDVWTTDEELIKALDKAINTGDF